MLSSRPYKYSMKPSRSNRRLSATSCFTASESGGNWPTIQCRPSGPDSYEVSALGLINGLFGADENNWGFIYACGDTDTNLRWIPCSFLPVGKTNPATAHPQGYPPPAHNPKRIMSMA